MGQSSFKKHLNFTISVKYFAVAWPGSETRIWVMSMHKNHFKKQKYGTESLSKIWWNILHCGMTRFRNVKLGVFRQYQNTKTILKKKKMGENRFKKLSKFKKLQLRNFILTCSNGGKINSVRLDQQKLKNDGKTYFKKHFNYTIFVKYCVMAISSDSNCFLMGIERSLPKSNYKSIWKYSNSTAAVS